MTTGKPSVVQLGEGLSKLFDGDWGPGIGDGAQLI